MPNVGSLCFPATTGQAANGPPVAMTGMGWKPAVPPGRATEAAMQTKLPSPEFRFRALVRPSGMHGQPVVGC